jgi:release factor glutamine methyltransferase
MNALPTLREALTQAGDLERIDAQMLLLMALGRDAHDRAWLLTHDDHSLDAISQARWDALLQRRRSGEPLAYLSGEKEFFGLRLKVDARVLVPRPDTETLVQWALEMVDARPGPLQLLDMGTGSGAIALALKSQRPALSVSASDASPDALAVARSNAAHLGLKIDFFAGSWIQAVPGRRFDLIVSNPPYIAEADPHLAALAHEPLGALAAGADGLDDLRDIVEHAPPALLDGGALLLEHGFDQASAVRALLAQRGFDQVFSRNDLAGIARCSSGIWPQAR